MITKSKRIKLLTNVVATFSGNSLAMIAKLAVKNAALPKASTILITNDNIIKGKCPSTLSKNLYKKEEEFH